ncbi:TetR/AcrR family transcriptional regulator [Bacteroidota bacterium]
MSPKTREQFEEIRENKKNLIMETALELFANEGFHAVSISKIAKTAGISKGLMYNYFESKEELIQEIVFKGFDDIMKLFDPNKDGILTDDEFDYFIDESFRLLVENRRFWKLYFSIILQPSVMGLVHDKLMKMLNPLIKTTVAFFEQKGSKDPLTDAMFFNATLDGIFFNYANNPELFQIEKLKSKIRQMFKCYIEKPDNT